MGASSLQGTHQDAQKLRSTGLPRRAESFTEPLLPRSGALKSGALLPGPRLSTLRKVATPSTTTNSTAGRSKAATRIQRRRFVGAGGEAEVVVIDEPSSRARRPQN